ncbi:MAG: acetate--CoA ligase family protein [candidate division NC10 bacterium]|nr:acetate--CoA ligase family protein [candidate division NC10 bacterium]
MPRSDRTAPAGETARRLIEQARAEQRHLLEPEAYRLLEAYELPVPRHRFARDAAEAAAAAQAIGFPVALKVVSPDVLHKSDAGGVRLDLRDAGAVRAAFEEVRAAARAVQPSARLTGALVAEMARPGTEVIVGMTRDPQFGPSVMFGLGGLFVEVYRDVAFRIVPREERDAREMIREGKGLPLLTGFRGRPPGDLDAIARILLRVSRLAEEHAEVAEVDLNPIVVHERGAVVLDARVFLDLQGTPT